MSVVAIPEQNQEEEEDQSSFDYDSDAPSEVTDRSDLDEAEIERMRARRKNRVLTWSSLPITDKFALFNKWSML